MRGRREEYRGEGGTGAGGPTGPPHLKGAVVMRRQVTEVVLRRPVPPRLLLHQCRGLPHTGRQERHPPPRPRPPAARPAPAAPARAHRLTDARRLVALVKVGQRVHHHIARHQPRARHAAPDSALCACAGTGPPPIAAAAVRLRTPPSPRAPPNIPRRRRDVPLAPPPPRPSRLGPLPAPPPDPAPPLTRLAPPPPLLAPPSTPPRPLPRPSRPRRGTERRGRCEPWDGY